MISATASGTRLPAASGGLAALPACRQQLAQVLGCQGGDPVQTGRQQFLADARRREHAAVADQGDAGDAEALADAVHLPSQRGRIGRVAREHLDRQGAAGGRAQQPEHDLLLALLAVAVVAEGGQRAEPTLEVAGADVVQDQGGVAEVPVGEAGLDPALAGQQPVEHGEHLVAGDGSETQQGAETAVGGFRGQAAGGGELGVRGEQARHDGGEREVALAAAVAVQDGFEAELAAGAQHGGDMAVGPGALDAQELGSVLDGKTALEDSAEAVDDLGREAGEVGEGFLANALAFAPSLAEQDGGFAGSVGDDFDVERHEASFMGTVQAM